MTTAIGQPSTGAQRRKEWRARLGERGLAEKKIMIRVADAPLFLKLAERTRTGESLGDVLFDLASQAAPPAAPLPPAGAGDRHNASAANDGPVIEAVYEMSGGGLRVAMHGAEIVAEYQAAIQSVRTLMDGEPDLPIYRLRPADRETLPPALVAIAFAAPPDLGAPSPPAPAHASSREGEAPLVLVDAEPSGEVDGAPEAKAAVTPSTSPVPIIAAKLNPPSWRRTQAGGSIDRLRGRAWRMGDHARRTVSPPLFFAIAVAVALFLASIVIYALKAPTVEAGHIALAPGAEAAQIAGAEASAGPSPDGQARRMAALEAENLRLADHLEALLAELDGRRKAPLSGPAKARKQSAGPSGGARGR